MIGAMGVVGVDVVVGVVWGRARGEVGVVQGRRGAWCDSRRPALELLRSRSVDPQTDSSRAGPAHPARSNAGDRLKAGESADRAAGARPSLLQSRGYSRVGRPEPAVAYLGGRRGGPHAPPYATTAAESSITGGASIGGCCDLRVLRNLRSTMK